MGRWPGSAKPPSTPSPEGATYPIPQTNLHHGGTEAQRKTGGCSAPQAARADGRAPLLIQEGDGAVSAGGGYEIQEGSAAEAMMSVNRKYGACPGFPPYPPSCDASAWQTGGRGYTKKTSYCTLLDMAIESALQQLESEVNSEIAWAFGDVLRLWSGRTNWRTCLLLQNLETNHPNLASWNELIRRTRHALSNDTELQVKAKILLSPGSIRFDDVMEDFIAEMLAAQYLQSHGHSEIRFVSVDEAIHTDLQSRYGDYVCVTEAKNLREPRALTKAAFRRWNTNKAAAPERYQFTADLVDIDDPLSDLTSEQEAAVVAFIDELPQLKRPSRQIRDLPGGPRVSVRVSDGRSVIITQGGGPFRIDGTYGLEAQGQRGLILKLLEPTRKALSQLYADSVPADYRRLLYMRWKPPEQFRVTPEGLEKVRRYVQEGVRSFVYWTFLPPPCYSDRSHIRRPRSNSSG